MHPSEMELSGANNTQLKMSLLIPRTPACIKSDYIYIYERENKEAKREYIIKERTYFAMYPTSFA